MADQHPPLKFDATGEVLRLDLDAPLNVCAICRAELENGQIRLALEVVWQGEPNTVAVCRFCLAEYAPRALAVVEAAPRGKQI